MRVVRQQVFYGQSSDAKDTDTKGNFSVCFPDSLLRVFETEQVKVSFLYFAIPKDSFASPPTEIRFTTSLPRQNLDFDPVSGSMDFTKTIAIIPYDPTPDVFVYIPQDTTTWSQLLPNMGSKIGTLRFTLTDQDGKPIEPTNDYEFVLRFEILQDDTLPVKELLTQMVHFQKLILLKLAEKNDEQI